MFKPKKEDLKRSVTVGDLIEFKDGIGEVVADIVKKEVGVVTSEVVEAKNEILGSKHLEASADASV